MDRPVVLCGLGRMGDRVLDTLLTAGITVVVIDTVCKPDDPRLKGVRLISGDCRRKEILEQAGVATAAGVLILTNDDLLNITTTLTVRSLNREVRIVIRMFNQNLLSRLGKSIHNVFALSTSLLTAPILATTALTGQGLGTFRLHEGTDGLRQLVEVTVGPTSNLRGLSIGNVMAYRDVVVVAHSNKEEQRELLDLRIDDRVEVGDKLVVSAAPVKLAPLLTSESVETELRMGGWLRRNLRMIWRTFAEMDRAVLICTIVLTIVVITSTLVLSLGVTKYKPADALLRTVSLIATASGMHEEDYEDAPGIRIFVSCLRIFGAVLMAAFTAMVTNYLIRARLGGVLEVRRIPERGHVIVCGLSTVGFRVVDELIRLGERVVAIEQDPSNRFVTTARRLGAAVMIGDPGVVEVLKQAFAGDARAVVPATNNDMTNLEVALLVRELNPNQRVVVLINDPQFATMLREAAGIRLAVSVPALAAPAFVAGLFGDRVISVVLLHERLFAILDLLITDQDLLYEQHMRIVAVDYHILPLALIHDSKAVAGGVMNSRLGNGDRLIGIIALTDLERLLRRQPTKAACAIDVIACPLPQREWLIGMIRKEAGVSAEEAAQMVANLPCRIAKYLTRGQAEDLLAQLHRERITARVCPADEPLSSAK